MSIKRKGIAVMATVAMGALVLAGCDGTAGGGSTKTATGNTDTITVGIDQAPDAYNGNTAAANSVYNAWVDNATQGTFAKVLPDGTIEPQTDFGTYEKTSDDPLTIEYEFSDKAVWSDGTPIDCDDAVLWWLANSGKSTTGEKDEDGNDKVLFQAAGNNGFSLVQAPTCAAGDKKFTFVYDQPYVDWEAVGSTTMVPAHIAAEQGGMSTDDDGKALVDAIQANDLTALTDVAEFWNNGWTYQKDLPSLPDLKLIPASGPYKYDNASGGALTVVKNDKWWGTEAKTERIVFKTVDAASLVKAMSNGEIDVFQPSAVEQDTVKQLDELGDKVTYETGSSWTYSHIDLAQAEGQVFNDIRVRQAFLKCVPRQDLVDKFVIPVYAEGAVLNSHEYFPNQSEYQESLAAAPTSTMYDEVDIEGAKALLAEAGMTEPVTVRLLRAQQSEMRGQQVQLIKASCDQAGFNIVDQADAEWSAKLPEPGAWDAVLFAWSGSGLIAAAEPQYITGGAQNFGKYSNPEIDTLWSQITTLTDSEQAPALKFQSEEQLWSNPYNVVLYANPALQANTSNVKGPEFNPNQYGPTWNVWEWTKS